MPASLAALALAAFGIGTTEFVILGLLSNVASDLAVSIPVAGWLVTGYALAVAIGAPAMAIATAKLPRKQALVGLMGIFIVGNVLCAVATGYSMLMLARVVTALCHGAFFGIGAVVASGLVAEDKRASAVALMFTGLTLANVLGVPLGTALGQAWGWRATFWAVALIGVVALAALVLLLPREAVQQKTDLRRELCVFRERGVWMALGMTVFSSGSMFAMFTYIAPILGEVTGLSPHAISGTLLVIGVGLTIGNVVGGRLADWKLMPTLVGLFIAMAAVQLIFTGAAHSTIGAEIAVFAWAMIAFAAVPALQIGVVTQAHEAPNLASTLNIGAFNVGNALGAWAGGRMILAGAPLNFVPLAGALLAIGGLTLALFALNRRPARTFGPSTAQ
ncbi:MFS transporter [Paucibacter sp. R3-3]|uniref:MFS transporter n=1 Tax=Roseateles agri TaxID=3098619 RepID=A0ABU5DJB0_9BURK|nr:MFS transporter [Paucibacter sp. R3-3]MDY0746380.1 MFS transporter [Paucibacter sp. R3-3]